MKPVTMGIPETAVSKPIKLTLPGMLAYGAAIELAQWAIGWRFAEWAGLAADAVGVLVAWMIVGWVSLEKDR